MTMGYGNSAAHVSLALFVAMALASAHGAHAQQRSVAIWEVPLGTPVSELPPEFKITACGTNGGPQSTPLRGFEEYSRCPAEPETGLHEVWFSYDDEREYYLRAIRADPAVIYENRANQLFDHVVVYSLLFDAEGRVQGHRIASDQREDPELRETADMLEGAMKVLAYGAGGWNCTNLPRRDGEEPFGGTFVKRLCEKVDDDGRYITLRTHRFLRQGQQAAGRAGAPLANEFEVGTWVEMINADLVGKATER